MLYGSYKFLPHIVQIALIRMSKNSERLRKIDVHKRKIEIAMLKEKSRKLPQR